MEETKPLAGNLTLFQRTQKIQQQVTNNITTDTILATDNFNIYYSQAMNGIGPVLFRRQWDKDLTQPSWILYYVFPNSIILTLDLTINPLYFLI